MLKSIYSVNIIIKHIAMSINKYPYNIVYKLLFNRLLLHKPFKKHKCECV